jgi:histidine decarboxylase
MPRKKSADSKVLDQLYRQFEKAAKEMAGYPLCQFFDYSKLFHFLKFHINNLGDPFLKSWYYRINTLKIERKVIDRFAELFHAPKGGYWGYVTNGGTEGNLYGLYIARELHPEGVVVYSNQTHYSVPKCLRLLRMDNIKVGSLPNGEIDYHALQDALLKEKRTPIIFANIGTTMKGAVDNVVRIKEILADLKIKKYYIHCDAAFFGMILPFLPELETEAFDFRIGIDSIAISGHKMIGTPFPCGVVLTKKKNLELIGTHIEYTGAKDNTITGSRNGLTPLFLWQELLCAKEEKMESLVKECIEMAGYAVKKFNDAGIKAWRNKNSMIVIFPRPSEKIIAKWQLAVEGEIAHLITLPHVPHKVIDLIVAQIVADLKKRKLPQKLPDHLP